MDRIGRILVAVDPSAGERQAAVDKAAHLARRLGASIELLICETAAALGDPAVTNTHLLNLLETLAAPLRAQQTTVALRIIHGKSLPDSLLDYVANSGADMVVKDTHSHSFAGRTLLRNTDWHLTRGCPVPLLLTKAKAWGPAPVILAAVDPNHGDPRAAASDRAILSRAAALTRRLMGDLHVVHTYIPTAFAAAIAAGGRSTTPEYSEALRAENSFKYC